MGPEIRRGGCRPPTRETAGPFLLDGADSRRLEVGPFDDQDPIGAELLRQVSADLGGEAVNADPDSIRDDVRAPLRQFHPLGSEITLTRGDAIANSLERRETVGETWDQADREPARRRYLDFGDRVAEGRLDDGRVHDHGPIAVDGQPRERVRCDGPELQLEVARRRNVRSRGPRTGVADHRRRP